MELCKLMAGERSFLPHGLMRKYWKTEDIKTAIEENPLAVADSNSAQRNALHVGMEAGAPEDILLLAIRACPKALSMQDEEGNTPLHLGVHRRNTTNVLVAAIRACPEALIIKNSDGNCVLHNAMIYKAPEEAVFAIVCTNSETANFLDSSDRTPAQLGCNDKIRKRLRDIIAASQIPLTLKTVSKVPTAYKSCILNFFMTAKRVDDIIAESGSSCIPKDLWWHILSMLSMTDLMYQHKNFKAVENR